MIFDFWIQKLIHKFFVINLWMIHFFTASPSFCLKLKEIILVLLEFIKHKIICFEDMKKHSRCYTAASVILGWIIQPTERELSQRI